MSQVQNSYYIPFTAINADGIRTFDGVSINIDTEINSGEAVAFVNGKLAEMMPHYKQIVPLNFQKLGSFIVIQADPALVAAELAKQLPDETKALGLVEDSLTLDVHEADGEGETKAAE